MTPARRPAAALRKRYGRASVSPILAGDRVRIAKGCKARDVAKGATAVVTAVELLGAEYSYAVRIALQFFNGNASTRIVSFYARHPNRLADGRIRLNDGNPTHTIEIVRK
jgi:hypothetical protein